MRFKNGLALFGRTNCQHTWNVASFHSPHSLTWSWVLSWHFHQTGWAQWWPLFWWYQTNHGPHWGLRLPGIGYISWQQQRPMWYRDLYLRKRDELEAVKHERNAFERQVPRRPTERKLDLVPTPSAPLNAGKETQ